MKYYYVVLAFISMLVHQDLYAHDEFVSVIAASKPAVVMVEATRKKGWLKSPQEKEREALLGDYAEFFAEEFKDLPDISSGSGFVVSRDGLILTAAHVVHDASNISVHFVDGSTAVAELIRFDLSSDLALLKIDGKQDGYSFLNLSEQAPQEGQAVLSMGSAFGLPVSSSLGIISALNVKLSKRSKVSLLQTDAANNPGSSGGPLLNSDGKVVGLISKIYSNTGAFSGSAFAVEATDLLVFLER